MLEDLEKYLTKVLSSVCSIEAHKANDGMFKPPSSGAMHLNPVGCHGKIRVSVGSLPSITCGRNLAPALVTLLVDETCSQLGWTYIQPRFQFRHVFAKHPQDLNAG